MRSYAVFEWGEPLRLLEGSTPEPTGKEVLVRVTAAGVCHSDLHIHEGQYDLGGGSVLRMEDRGLSRPLTMGHETAGIVEAVGPDATGVEIGQQVAVYPWIGCGECDACQLGEEQNCPSPRTLGIYAAGGYSSHLLVPDGKYCLDIGDIPPEVAALYACSGITTYSALKKIDPRVLANEPILIVGAGGLGLMALTILKGLDAHGAIVADIDPVKRDAAMAAGAIATVDPTAPDAVDQVKALSGSGRGLRAAIDLVGNPATANFAIDTFVKGAQLISVGLMGGAFMYPLPYFPMRALTVQGSYVGSLQDMRELMALVRERQIVPPPITKRPLDDASTVLDELRTGQITGRAVLVPES
ncbi:MAG TPA: alcohol dehydrogenase [Thermomicrobiales bacterium]|nr:alcohol dehydrogenase [Thermomicrobiales bacterium]